MSNNNKRSHFKTEFEQEELPCTFYASNFENVQTGQNDLWPRPKATLNPK